MRRIDFAPEAINDLLNKKEYLEQKFGSDNATFILEKIMDSIGNLELFPDAGISLFDKYGIESDYYYLIIKKNYVFFRYEEETIKIIRVLDDRQDFMYTLFGIKSEDSDAEDYWNE